MRYKKVVTDLLVIGGSGAGVMASVYASKSDVKVTLVSKGKVGFSGNAIMAGGGFGIDGQSASELGIKDADKSFTRDRMFDCIVKESFYLSDQDMVEQYVKEGPIAVNKLLEWKDASKQKFLFFKPANWIMSGLSIGKSLRYGLKQHPEVEVFEDVIIFELIKDKEKVCGALGIDIINGEFIFFESKATIIGTGGYQPFSENNTVTDMTGDGQAMALRAGASLSDMEFILAFPTAVYPEHMKGSIYPFIFEYNMRDLKYDIIDKNGEIVNISEDVIRASRGGKLSKLITTYYFGKCKDENLLGSHDGWFYDYSQNSVETIDKSFETLYNRFDNWHKHGYYKGESLAEVEKIIYDKKPLEVGMGFEYCMGGIEVNDKMETSVEGLYAAGEVTSGVFGACRVGDGIVEMLAQGMRAGLSASEYIKNTNRFEVEDELIVDSIEKVMKYLDDEDGVNAIQIYKSIEKACDEGFSYLRDEEGMEKALNTINCLIDQQKSIRTKEKSLIYNVELINAISSENLLQCVKASIISGIERKESRGCHIRKDYPEVDFDNYTVKNVVSLDENNNFIITKRKPRITKIALKQGKSESVVEYFMDPSLNYRR